MNRNDKRTRLASIDASALGSVAGGRNLDLMDSWAFGYLSSPSCYRDVLHAAAAAGFPLGGGISDAWPDAAWNAANDAASAAWNGPSCANYGWW